MFIHSKNLIRNKISCLCFCLCILFIFYNSSLPAIESSNVSEGLTYKIYELLNLNIDFQPFHVFIRKLAHFIEYACLGTLAYFSFTRIKWMVCISILVSCFDETIQLFVEGRSGQISDVLLDCFGVICAIGILHFIHKLCFHEK